MQHDNPEFLPWRESQNLEGYARVEDSLFKSFLGRAAELDWLIDRTSRGHSFAPIIIAGLAGVGKTTLLKMYFATRRARGGPIWLNLGATADPMAEASAFVESLYQDRDGGSYVVIDNAEMLSDEQLEELGRRVLSLKRIRTLFILTRRTPVVNRAEILNISPLNLVETTALLQRLNSKISSDDLIRAAEITAGVPRAVKLLVELVQRYPGRNIDELLRGDIYDFRRDIVTQPTNLISQIKPKIVIANEELLNKLKNKPDHIFQLPSRKFEEVLAELLSDMGFEVELTKETRDGGKDILAYMNTKIGKFLCLVEAKKFRRDRTVGVELVRTLYGTLCDHQANSAMLVTTSSFSQDARAFQKKHEYQLSLHDYGNIVGWIQDYKQR